MKRIFLQALKFPLVVVLMSGCYHGHHEELQFGKKVSELTEDELRLRNEILTKNYTVDRSGTTSWSTGSIDLNKPTRIILQVDGGGIMGITPAVVLNELDRRLQKKSGKELRDICSIVSGTSTGAIITGMLAAGVKTETIKTFYTEDGVRLFQSEGRQWAFPIRPKFSRPIFQDRLLTMMDHDAVPRQITLGEMKKGPWLIIPAYDLRSRRTVYFTNHSLDPHSPMAENLDGTRLADAISASGLSAPWYFGKLISPAFVWDQTTPEGVSTWEVGAAFQDGGQGTQNNTLGLLLLLGLCQGWAEDGQQLIIISLGTGSDYSPRSFGRVKNYSLFAQAIDFIRNQARAESIQLQVRAVRLAAQMADNVKFFRFDYTKGKKANDFSSKRHKDYVRAGEDIVKRPEFEQLAESLTALRAIRKGNLKVPEIVPTSPDEEVLRSLIRRALESTKEGTRSSDRER